MLVINYNGNKPTTDYFKFSVQGNNNADVVRFCLEKKQGKIDLSGYKVYVQAYCEEDDFIDKVEITDNVNIVDNQLSADWTLLKKHTVNRQLQVSLSFEDLDNEVVWQTQIVKITIANGIDADEEMINKYPTVIEEMQKDINELKNKPSKEFVYYKRELHHKVPLGILLGLRQRKNTKGQRLNASQIRGKKFGNTITGIILPANNNNSTSILEVINNLFPNDVDIEAHYVEYTQQEVQSMFNKVQLEYKGGGMSLPTISPFLEGDQICKQIVKYGIKINERFKVSAFDIKFVKDYSQENIQQDEQKAPIIKWSGTMANNYINMCVYVEKIETNPNQYKAVFLPVPRRFK